MLTKETLIKVIKQIQFQDEFEEKVGNAFELINTSYTVLELSKYIRNSVDLLLESFFNPDVVVWLAWWLYEETDKEVVLDNGVKKDLAKIEDFVDFLFEDCKKI